MTMRVNLYIPTLNGGERFLALLEALKQQTQSIQRCVVVDSGSKDGTVAAARGSGFDVIGLGDREFDHGGTRQRAIEAFPDADIYIFLTQDAVPANAHCLSAIVSAFDDPQIGMAYGRQLPRRDAGALERHARLFNYPEGSQVRKLEDAGKYGIKTISCSNSFAAYRRAALESVAGFPVGTIMGEDVITAGRMLLAGWEMAYVGGACVYHSHDYRIKDEFERYFDIGVFHSDNRWIFDSFGKADNEGFRYVKSELRYVIRHNVLLLPKTCCSFVAKWVGYKFGLAYRKFPIRWRKRFSMYKAYWLKGGSPHH